MSPVEETFLSDIRVQVELARRVSYFRGFSGT
jgi:hypothetical protein